MREYIESGILSVYALGIASEEERKEVEKAVALYPELWQELQSLQNSLHEYASQFEITPPTWLKNKVLGAFPAQNPQTDAFIGTKKTTSFRYGMAASIVLLAGSLIGNAYLYNRWQNTKNDLSIAQNQGSVIAKNQQILEAKYKTLESEIAMTQNPAFKISHLEGLKETAPSGYATVFWNNNAEQAYISATYLPKPPVGKQYQLWALMDDNSVVDAGMIEWGKTSAVKYFKKPQKLIITLEREGGVPKAEGKAYAIGSLSS